MPTEQQTFGKYIAESRKGKGLSQKELAQNILREEDGQSISPQYLNDIEKDRRTPSSDHMIEQFATILELDKDYLYYLVGNLPADIRDKNLKPNEVSQFFQAFRGGPPIK